MGAASYRILLMHCLDSVRLASLVAPSNAQMLPASLCDILARTMPRQLGAVCRMLTYVDMLPKSVVLLVKAMAFMGRLVARLAEGAVAALALVLRLLTITPIRASDMPVGATVVNRATSCVIRILPFTVRVNLDWVVLIVVHIVGMLVHRVPLVLVPCSVRRDVESREPVEVNLTWLIRKRSVRMLRSASLMTVMMCPDRLMVWCSMTVGGTRLGRGNL